MEISQGERAEKEERRHTCMTTRGKRGETEGEERRRRTVCSLLFTNFPMRPFIPWTVTMLFWSDVSAFSVSSDFRGWFPSFLPFFFEPDSHWLLRWKSIILRLFKAVCNVLVLLAPKSSSFPRIYIEEEGEDASRARFGRVGFSEKFEEDKKTWIDFLEGEMKISISHDRARVRFREYSTLKMVKLQGIQWKRLNIYETPICDFR